MIIQRAAHCYTGFLIAGLIAFIAIICGCNSSGPVENSLEILIPKTGYTYASYDTLYLVVKFNPEVAAKPQWQFSIDSGKAWNDISFFSRRSATKPVDDDPFEYDVHRWVPEKDSLRNITVYLKANSYGNSALFDKVGPVYIE